MQVSRRGSCGWVIPTSESIVLADWHMYCGTVHDRSICEISKLPLYLLERAFVMVDELGRLVGNAGSCQGRISQFGLGAVQLQR